MAPDQNPPPPAAPLPFNPETAAANARFVHGRIPPGGLFSGHDWRISPSPFALGEKLATELETLGRVLLQFNRAVNLLYRKSVEGKQPEWVARWLDQGKPAELIELQRSSAVKNEVPRVIRPDILLTDSGFSITELDSVPGGIGLTGWLNQTYSELGQDSENKIIGGADGMIKNFARIFGDAACVRIVVSEESATYRPEMEWLAGQMGSKFKVQSSTACEFNEGDAIYRFFELFDLKNIPCAGKMFELVLEKKIRLTPAPKPIFEEKLLFALLWNRNLRSFWRQELGESFLDRLQKIIPYTWLMDPTPLPPQGAVPGLDLTDWQQLKALSQRERELILKISGYSEKAWGSRGVYLGSDLSQAEWSGAVDEALSSFPCSPYVLQRFHKTKVVPASWFDLQKNQLVPMESRVRLCPYYFVTGEGDAARAQLSGVLATICPADKKIIHGMRDAILAPCSI
jgi:hypothetical protein